ncbi:MAG: protein kinase [Polyangiaceae bacterium]|nr:protein kinase [Polyangiaceae bacterium]
MALQEGDLVQGKYRVVRIIGEGGMGAVFEGENIRINRRVAIKVLHAALASNKEVVQRFEREAQAAGRIGNDHILEVLDLGDLPDGDFFMVMEYLEGEPLSDRIRRLGRMSPEQVAPLMAQVLTGLQAAHTAGIIHRDLKPDNIFVLKEKAGQKDFVKIIDFGISKFQPLGGEMKMTRTGSVMGTPYYMSPEQASGSSEADHRSDVYAVGVMMYEAVTGKVPFEASTFNQLLFKIVLDEVPKPETIVPDLDPGFASLIHKAMARDKEARFQDCTSLRNAILEWQRTGAAVSVPPPGGVEGHLPGKAREAFGSQTDVMPAATPPGGARLGTGSQPSVVVAQEGNMSSTTGAGTWSTEESIQIPKKGGAGLLYAGIAAGVLIVGGGAFFALSGGKQPDAAAAAASAQAAASQAPAAQPPAKPVEAPPPVAQPTVEPVAVEPAKTAEPPKVEPANTASKPVAKPTSRPKPAVKPAVRPAAKPGPSPKKPDTPDFGY